MSQAAVAPITSTIVDDEQRMAFLPTYFGVNLMIRGEGLVYNYLRSFCEAYTGGLWNYFELSNGGFYMAPASTERFKIEVCSNFYSGEMSADAAGIVASLYALCHLANSPLHPRDADRMIDHYHRLLAFASEHPEARAIHGACD